ncbi:cytochrome b-c1 complex subunit 7-like [Gigantopelta aegis]|uniref:cytochrome b-c1 complex subunit 7-like n=1 Tax=Gigantopelta aegis TaxID=1735272 RepID=UPI001B8896C8|nr:cytochrome b-c1 complex subunit 7-like [Gigantopelta aegis]
MAARRVAKEVPAWQKALAKWAYNRSYFNQIGLMRDDILDESSDVKEALRRLPKDEYDARMFRIVRALHLSGKKEILPKAEWTSYERDVKYLTPYLEEIQKEKQEKREWNKQ